MEIPSPDREQYELVQVDRKTGAEIRHLPTGAGISGKGVAPTIDSLKGLPAYPPYISAMIRRSCAASSADNRSSSLPIRCLLIARIWSTAISASFPAH